MFKKIKIKIALTKGHFGHHGAKGQVLKKYVFFNRAVFLMESTLNIIIIIQRDDLLLILNDFFN